MISAACLTGMLGDGLPDAARYALVLVFSCCVGVIPASVLSGVAVHARTPSHIGTTNGMVMQMAQIGQSIGPILLAWLASHYGGWGVTLWARAPEFVKDIVYGMRFDEASAKYAEFGPFYLSYIMSPAEAIKHLKL